MKKAIPWVAAGVVALSGGLYAAKIAYMLGESPTQLLACMKSESGWMAWTCRQVLLRASLTPERVAEMNSRAGALFAASYPDPVTADEVLSLFISRGVDIDAGDSLANRLTALHVMAGDGNVERARLLLNHGARRDVKDDQGETPLSYAKRELDRHPEDNRRRQMVELLQSSSAPRG